ncbi:cop9 signalosome complex subunit 6b [Phtheirospermum japonicum]|uniref:Cop9 signalosome complex subunit 6b n=1 Tax=Phtheirospermum japonicum TaxID=374723 RepID=A0A830BTU2_9LAMI|nr:cop9 signalosome complex subunit 6b [Phtheirospermum japonicum]
MIIHKALMDINESPVYVLLNPSINPAQKDLHVTIYESCLNILTSLALLLESNDTKNIVLISYFALNRVVLRCIIKK